MITDNLQRVRINYPVEPQKPVPLTPDKTFASQQEAYS